MSKLPSHLLHISAPRDHVILGFEVTPRSFGIKITHLDLPETIIWKRNRFHFLIFLWVTVNPLFKTLTKYLKDKYPDLQWQQEGLKTRTSPVHTIKIKSCPFSRATKWSKVLTSPVYRTWYYHVVKSCELKYTPCVLPD